MLASQRIWLVSVQLMIKHEMNHFVGQGFSSLAVHRGVEAIADCWVPLLQILVELFPVQPGLPELFMPLRPGRNQAPLHWGIHMSIWVRGMFACFKESDIYIVGVIQEGQERLALASVRELGRETYSPQ